MKQKTAMTELRNKLLEVTPDSDSEYNKGYMDALKSIATDIDVQMLAKEREQLEEMYIQGREDYLLRDTYFKRHAKETYEEKFENP